MQNQCCQCVQAERSRTKPKHGRASQSVEDRGGRSAGSHMAPRFSLYRPYRLWGLFPGHSSRTTGATDRTHTGATSRISRTNGMTLPPRFPSRLPRLSPLSVEFSVFIRSLSCAASATCWQSRWSPSHSLAAALRSNIASSRAPAVTRVNTVATARSRNASKPAREHRPKEPPPAPRVCQSGYHKFPHRPTRTTTPARHFHRPRWNGPRHDGLSSI